MSIARPNLVPCAISARGQQTPDKNGWTVEVYHGMAAVRRTQPASPARPQQQPPPKRGQITTFSRKSRHRMVKKLATKTPWQRGLFMTFTLPDEVWFGECWTYSDFHTALLALFMRIDRKWPDAGYIWRIELELRKSGLCEGQPAPHVHVLVDGIADDIGDVRKWAAQAWHEVLSDGRCDLPKKPRIDVQAIGSRRKAMRYVSKYCAKAQDESFMRNITEYNKGLPGRWWGVRGKWETPVTLVMTITHAEYLNFRRYARKYHRAAGRGQLAKWLCGSPERGFSLFWGTEGPDGTNDPFASLIVKIRMHLGRLHAGPGEDRFSA